MTDTSQNPVLKLAVRDFILDRCHQRSKSKEELRVLVQQHYPQVSIWLFRRILYGAKANDLLLFNNRRYLTSADGKKLIQK